MRCRIKSGMTGNLLTYSPTNLLTLKSTPHPVFRFSAKAQNRKQTSPSRGEVKKVAFTLAEVLITLGIIGVVAAMTIPTVIEKHQNQVTVNRLKKVYSTLSQMLVKSYADNGPVTSLKKNDRVDGDLFKEFMETYWFPYLIKPTVAKASFYKTNMPYGTLKAPHTKGGMNIFTSYNGGRIVFSTQDGTIYFVNISDWGKDEDGNDDLLITSWMDVRVDINGVKPPNIYGKDVFMFKVNFDSNVVKPRCYDSLPSDINDNCSKNGNGDCCAARIIQDGWEIKY